MVIIIFIVITGICNWVLSCFLLLYGGVFTASVATAGIVERLLRLPDHSRQSKSSNLTRVSQYVNTVVYSYSSTVIKKAIQGQLLWSFLKKSLNTLYNLIGFNTVIRRCLNRIGDFVDTLI